MTSSLGLTTIAPLLGALVAAALGYIFGRLLETRKQLTLQKGQAYADYLKALAMAANQSSSKDILALAADAKTRVCIYGAPAVIQHLAAFERAGARIESDESRAVVADLVKAMRIDMGIADGRVRQTDLHDILFGPKGPR
jgi:hypothetical protein